MPNDAPDYTSVTQTSESAITGSPFTIPRDGNNHVIGTFAIPQGAQALVIVCDVNTFLVGVSVVGTTTNAAYGGGRLDNQNFGYVRLHPSIDPSVKIQFIVSSGSGNAVIGISWLFGESVLDLDPQAESRVILQGPLGDDLDTTVGADTFVQAVVSQDGANPAPWQAAKNSFDVDAHPGALNTDFTIIAAQTGETIYVHDVALNTNSGTFWTVILWDGPSSGDHKLGRLFVNIFTGVGVGLPARWDGRGRPLTKGNALIGTLANGDVGSTIFGIVGASQE